MPYCTYLVRQYLIFRKQNLFCYKEQHRLIVDPLYVKKQVANFIVVLRHNTKCKVYLCHTVKNKLSFTCVLQS